MYNDSMIEKTLETESGNIRYWISGEIRPDRLSLLFLHGLTASHQLFEQQLGHFSDRYNVITWDAPAHGLSRPFKDFTYEKAANALIRILDELGIAEAVFIGQSMGGFITQSVLKRAPERVKAFVSLDSTPFGEKYYSKSDRWWLRQVEWMSRLYPEKALKKAIAKQTAREERARRNMEDMLSVYEKNELCHLMGIGFAGFLEDNCDLQISCPTLLIVGEFDITGRVKQYNEQWAKELNTSVKWVKDAAHNSNDDQPEQVNRLIEEFLSGL